MLTGRYNNVQQLTNANLLHANIHNKIKCSLYTL